MYSVDCERHILFVIKQICSSGSTLKFWYRRVVGEVLIISYTVPSSGLVKRIWEPISNLDTSKQSMCMQAIDHERLK